MSCSALEQHFLLDLKALLCSQGVRMGKKRFSFGEQLRQGNVAQDLTQWYGGKMPLAMPRTVFLSRGTKQDSVPSA